MSEHKRFKRAGQRPASLDGFVSDGRSLGSQAHQSYQPKQAKNAPRLGSVNKRSDGFHPLSQSSGSLGRSPESIEAESLLNEPILLDSEEVEKNKRRHYFGHRRPRLHKFVRRAGMLTALLVLVGGTYFAYKFIVTEHNVLRGGGGAPALAETVDINKLKGEGDGRINVLLLGIGGPGHQGADLTDTIMLASIDPVNHKTALLSIPRDLWVKIPGDGFQKINAAYPYGKEGSKSKNDTKQIQDGLNELDQTLSPIIGVPIHYHAIVDFSAFKSMVDAVGGVSFNVPETLYDPTIAWENRNNPYIARAGVQSFDGQKALLYARSRETSSDFARAQRQRQVIVALKEKILSLGTFSNPVKISSLMTSLGNNVYTDFSRNDIQALYKIMGQIQSKDIVSLDLVTPPHAFLTTGNINGLSVVEPKSGLFEYDDIQNYVRNALRDGFLAKENATVAVYNATSVPGLATKKATELKSFGYNVPTIDNAPTSNPSTTVVVDFSKGVDKYTRHYLEGRFGVTARTSLPAGSGITPPAGTTFVIILGEDAANSR
jgi:LCP family protein required for cell wall assembly